MKIKVLALLASGSLLSGCYAMQGTPQIINSGGVVNQSGSVPERTENFKKNFRHAVDKSAKVYGDANWGQTKEMLDTGFLLVASNCDDYFRVMGSRQRDSGIARSMLAPVISLLTGVIALKDFQNSDRQQDFVEGLGIGSAAFLATLDIHDQHFLFGAENIFEVEQLTMDALDTSEAEIRSKGKMNFESAAKLLMRHDGICTPQGIKFLVKGAINSSEVKISRNSRIGTGLPEDKNLLFDLGQLVGGIPGEVSSSQAGALWWLFLGEPSSTEADHIAKILDGTNIARGVKNTGYDADAANVDERAILNTIRSFSDERLGDFEAARDRYRSEVAAREELPVAERSGEEPQFSVGDASSTSGFRLRVE